MTEQLSKQGETGSYTEEDSSREFILTYNKKTFSTIFDKPKMKEFMRPHLSPQLFMYDSIIIDQPLYGQNDLYSFFYLAKGKDTKRLTLVKNPQYQGMHKDLDSFDWAFSAIADSDTKEELLLYIDGQNNNKIYRNDKSAFLHAQNVLSEITLFEITQVGASV